MKHILLWIDQHSCIQDFLWCNWLHIWKHQKILETITWCGVLLKNICFIFYSSVHSNAAIKIPLYFIHSDPGYSNCFIQSYSNEKVKLTSLSVSQSSLYIFKVEMCFTIWKFWIVDEERYYNFKWRKFCISYWHFVLPTGWKS